MTHSDSGEHNIPTALVAAASGKDEERLLIERARNGDQEAFAQVVYKCDRGVLRLAYRMMGNAEDAQDVYQETFLKAYRYLHKFRFESSLSTWLYQIATNVCLDRLRQKQKRRESNFDETYVGGDSPAPGSTDVVSSMIAPHLSPERTLYGKEIGQQIDAAVSTLSETERLVFEMKHYGGLKLKNIGRILETTEGAAKNYLFRATRKLRAQLSHT